MMIDNPETPRRKLAGKLLLGGALVASLAMTATVLPAAAFATDGDEPEVKTEVKREHHVVLVTADSDGKVTVDGDAADGEKRIQRIIINKAGEDGPGPNVMVFGGDGTEIADGEKRIIRLQAPMMGLSAAEIEKTLVEQGVDAAKAKDIAAKLEAQRAEKMHSAMGAIHGAQGGAIHSMHFSSKDGMMVDMAGCKDGTNGKVLVDRSGEADGAKTKVRMVRCTDGPVDKAKEIAAMKKARERLASDLGKEGSMSREIRESVIADMDKAIAELEAGK